MNKKLGLIMFVGILFSFTAYAANDLGSISESVNVNKVISVGLDNSLSGNWYVGPISNINVLSARINSGSLLITGRAAGNATVLVCKDINYYSCLEVKVAVRPAGSVLGAYTSLSHPVGTWVLSGKTVFYISSTGIIPVSTTSIFSSNGGKLKIVQPANDGDLALPLQSLMTLKDSRVK
jgi:hypothetical protein